LRSDSFRAHGNSKGGKRDDLGGVYFRSTWEANYARILNLLMDRYIVADWEFEPDIFDLGDERYIPDFKVENMHGDIVYHEVKGYMDATSKRKLRKMAKQYPNVPLVLIDTDKYVALAATYAPMISTWEEGRYG